MAKAIKKIVKSDAVSAVTAAIDAFTGGLPVASVTQNIAKQFSSSRDALFVRKVQAVVEEIATLDHVLMGQAIQNLKDETGEDYFNEALFSAIEKSDSAKRSKMYGRLLVLSAKDPEAKSRFWEILNVLQTLMISDLEHVTLLVHYNENAIGGVGGGTLDRTKISRSRERRYRAAGIFVDDMEQQQDEELNLSRLVLMCQRAD